VRKLFEVLGVYEIENNIKEGDYPFSNNTLSNEDILIKKKKGLGLEKLRQKEFSPVLKRD
jgi:hypothetical protein